MTDPKEIIEYLEKFGPSSNISSRISEAVQTMKEMQEKINTLNRQLKVEKSLLALSELRGNRLLAMHDGMAAELKALKSVKLQP